MELHEAQKEIDGPKVAEIVNDFRREFRDVYPPDLLGSTMTGVGPMQALIGLAIKNGHLIIPQEK